MTCLAIAYCVFSRCQGTATNANTQPAGPRSSPHGVICAAVIDKVAPTCKLHLLLADQQQRQDDNADMNLQVRNSLTAAVVSWCCIYKKASCEELEIMSGPKLTSRSSTVVIKTPYLSLRRLSTLKRKEGTAPTQKAWWHASPAIDYVVLRCCREYPTGLTIIGLDKAGLCGQGLHRAGQRWVSCCQTKTVIASTRNLNVVLLVSTHTCWVSNALSLVLSWDLVQSRQLRSVVYRCLSLVVHGRCQDLAGLV